MMAILSVMAWTLHAVCGFISSGKRNAFGGHCLPLMLFEYHAAFGYCRRAKRLGLIYNRSALTILYASHDHHSQIP
ncbi:MAG: hypothetical protein RLZZ521_762, partial [Pseudomonadota bacterium]